MGGGGLRMSGELSAAGVAELAGLVQRARRNLQRADAVLSKAEQARARAAALLAEVEAVQLQSGAEAAGSVGMQPGQREREAGAAGGAQASAERVADCGQVGTLSWSATGAVWQVGGHGVSYGWYNADALHQMGAALMRAAYDMRTGVCQPVPYLGAEGTPRHV